MTSLVTRTAITGLFALAASASASAAPAMWAASDADSKVYLFGSVHVLPPGTQWRTPAFETALNAAPQVYFETDIGPLGMTALTFKMMGAMLSAVRDHWTDQLTPEQLQKLKNATEKAGLRFDQVEITPPWAVAIQLQMAQINPSKETLDPMQGVDATLQWEIPKERKGYFETPGQQYDMIAGDPIDVQVKSLMDSIDSADTSSPTIDDVAKSWMAGDVDAIAATETPTTPQDTIETQHLLYDRNRNWIPTIEKMLADNQQDLIVVGAGHLAGPGSVLDLLAKAGYTVTRVQ